MSLAFMLVRLLDLWNQKLQCPHVSDKTDGTTCPGMFPEMGMLSSSISKRLVHFNREGCPPSGCHEPLLHS